MKAFKVIGIAIFRDRNLGFEVLGLCNFKCYHITAELLISGQRAND